MAVVALSFVLPPNGFGVPACQFKEITHLPCLGCGLTRSYIGMAHLDLPRAMLFHPLGVPLFLLTVSEAMLLFAPSRVTGRAAAWAEGHGRLVNSLAVTLLALFLLYGLGRLIYAAGLLRTGTPMPW